jgi:hypothetical protein
VVAHVLGVPRDTHRLGKTFLINASCRSTHTC